MYSFFLSAVSATVDSRKEIVTSSIASIDHLEDAVIPYKETHPNPIILQFDFKPYYSPELTCDADAKPEDAMCCQEKNFYFCQDTAFENVAKSNVSIVLVAKTREHLLDTSKYMLMDVHGLHVERKFLIQEPWEESDANDNLSGLDLQRLDLGSVSVQKMITGADLCVCLEDMGEEVQGVVKYLGATTFLMVHENIKSTTMKSELPQPNKF